MSHSIVFTRDDLIGPARSTGAGGGPEHLPGRRRPCRGPPEARRHSPERRAARAGPGASGRQEAGGPCRSGTAPVQEAAPGGPPPQRGHHPLGRAGLVVVEEPAVAGGRSLRLDGNPLSPPAGSPAGSRGNRWRDRGGKSQGQGADLEAGRHQGGGCADVRAGRPGLAPLPGTRACPSGDEPADLHICGQVRGPRSRSRGPVPAARCR